MRSVGVLPATLLVLGAACGAAGLIAGLPVWCPALACVAALICWHMCASRALLAILAGGFLSVALILAGAARHDALHPTIRDVLDRRYGGFDIDSLGPGGVHDPIPLRAVIAEDAAVRGDVVALRVTATSVRLAGRWTPVSGGVLASVAGRRAASRMAGWRAGRRIEAPVTFRRPTRYLNDGVPDFERDLALGGTALFGTVKSGLLVDVLARGSRLDEVAADVRAHVRRAVGRHLGWRHEGAITGAIVVAVLIGDRTGLPASIRTRLQAAGTYHVIAISGGNIAILVVLVAGVLMLCGVRGRPNTLASMLVLLLFASMVTAGPSVWRATMMATIYFAARLLDHRAPAWHTVAMTAGLLAVVTPLDVVTVGFMLTFGATAALLWVARRAGSRRARGVVAWIAMTLAASAGVEVVLLPVAAEAFSRITVAGLVLNLLAIPLMAVVQVAGTVVALFDGANWLAGPAAWAAHTSAWGLIESARLVDLAPWLTRRVPPPSPWIIACYYAGLAGAVSGRRIIRPAGIAMLAGALVTIVWGGWPIASVSAGPPVPSLRLTVFDVGQGDSVLLEARGGPALLVDTGGRPFGGGGFDVGARVLAPALWARGLRSLGALLITHGDPDHIGGAAAVMADFAPERLWLGIPVGRHGPERLLLHEAGARGIAVERRRVGEALAFGRARLRVLHPGVADWVRPRVRNDDSVVIEVVDGDIAILLTGDVGADVERAILPHLSPARIRVLKVGHHGSRTSSSRELLEGWRPQVAIISCGRGNRFGHPAPEVLDRLRAIGATVYRTDRHGQVTLDSDGRVVRVRTRLGRQDTS